MKRKISNRRKVKEAAAGYLFLTPASILLITFIILPIIMSLLLSFTKYSGFDSPVWNSGANYKELFTSRDFIVSMKNTFIFVVVSVPAQTIISLLLAAILAANFRNSLGEFVRGALFIPVLCSSVLAGTVFYYLFASNADAAMNVLLSVFGIEKQNWLGQRNTALAIVCIVSVWKNIGYYLVIFYAGIMDVPSTLYEAARCDGATPIQQFLHITLPGIRSVLYLVITLGTIWGFQLFDLTYIMTKGGPGNATMTPGLLLYNEAFNSYRMGYACAVACVLALVILAVTVIQRIAFNEKAGGED